MSAERVVLEFGTLTVPVEVQGSGNATVSVNALGGGVFAVIVGGRRVLARFATEGTTHYLHVDGETYIFRRQSPHDPRPRPAARGYHDPRAPMPGVVTRIFVREGEDVAAGDPLYVVEAMKMETVIRAPVAGTVSRVRVAPGAQVEGGAVVVEVAAVEG